MALTASKAIVFFTGNMQKADYARIYTNDGGYSAIYRSESDNKLLSEKNMGSISKTFRDLGDAVEKIAEIDGLSTTEWKGWNITGKIIQKVTIDSFTIPVKIASVCFINTKSVPINSKKEEEIVRVLMRQSAFPEICEKIQDIVIK